MGGISFSGAVLSAPPLPWYCQTPEISRLGAGAGACLAPAFSCARDGADAAKARARTTANQIVRGMRRLGIFICTVTSNPFSGHGRRQKRFSRISLQKIQQALRFWREPA